MFPVCVCVCVCVCLPSSARHLHIYTYNQLNRENLLLHIDYTVTFQGDPQKQTNKPVVRYFASCWETLDTSVDGTGIHNVLRQYIPFLNGSWKEIGLLVHCPALNLLELLTMATSTGWKWMELFLDVGIDEVGFLNLEQHRKSGRASTFLE